ncbi:MAG: hypothetical protein J6K39_00695 [Clostridia bacterium]|nr:hypothetical protein [Clostridia bacterium]
MFNFLNEIKENLKNPKGFELGNFNIINISGYLLYVEGHLGLVTLSKELISFKVKKAVVVVEGKDMILSELSDNTIKICGQIKKVEQI